jgi:hypothetical protein
LTNERHPQEQLYLTIAAVENTNYALNESQTFMGGI